MKATQKTTSNTTTTAGVYLIGKREVLTQCSFDEGPCITEVQTIQTPAGVVEVDIWTESGRVVRVGSPRSVR